MCSSKESVSSKRRGRRGHGGVCLFIRDNVKPGISILEVDRSGFIWANIDKDFFNLDSNICICFAYIPPSDSLYFKSNDVGFLEKLEADIRKYSDVGKVILMGDLNARTASRNDFDPQSDSFEHYIPSIDTYLDECSIDIDERFSEDTVVNSSGLKLLDICKCSDLRVVNGRVGEDRGIGAFTFLASTGKSAIDYALAQHSLFPSISNFIVHDMFSCSSHVPIQLNIKATYTVTENNVEEMIVDKLVWDESKIQEFNDLLNNSEVYLNSIVSDVLTLKTDVSNGIESFAKELYKNAFKIFGVRKRVILSSNQHNNTFKRQHKNPWFTNECENARREFKHANKQYRRQRTPESSNLVVIKRRFFRKVNKRAKAQYNNKKKSELNNAAKHNPKKFWDLVRKYKNKYKRNGEISALEFYNHFRELFSENDTFVNDDVENLTNNDLHTNANIDQLDSDFSLDEITKAISALKRGKSPGLDMLIPELFLESKLFLAPLLCKLFNFIYNKCEYPESWTRGMLVPVPKKGNLNDVDNYRGIMLTNIFSKVFSIALDNRLRNWVESENILNDNQFGFRQNRSTVDCIFVLQSIINKVIQYEKKKLYCAFVDFKKAFDLVYRNGLWFKLLNSNISSKFVKMLQSMYKSVKICVKTHGSVSDYFDSCLGVKQGETLSPLLFIMFINDMSTQLYDDHADVISLNELQIFLLLFADDTVLFSYSANGLQTLLNKLHVYCSKWDITVNTKKTVGMVFKLGTRKENVELFYNNTKLDIVNKFTYLGVTLSSTGKCYQSQKALADQARRAIYSLHSLFDVVPLQISEKLKLFDSMIMPILNYGAEVWGLHKAPDIEKVYLKFLKQILNVRSQTTNAAVYGELGRIPLDTLRKEKILKYWFRIISSQRCLIKDVFEYQVAHKIQGSWALEIKKMLDNLGFGYLWINNVVTKLQLFKVIERLHDQYYQEWFATLNGSSKLSNYNYIKCDIGCESYLNCVKKDNYRVCLCRLRCSAHMLAIEEGRFRNIPQQDRKCIFCPMNVIENEYHFVSVCPCFRDIRNTCLPRYYCHWPSLPKYKQLMSTKKSSLLNKLAKYVYLANKRRDDILS